MPLLNVVITTTSAIFTNRILSKRLLEVYILYRDSKFLSNGQILTARSLDKK